MIIFLFLRNFASSFQRNPERQKQYGEKNDFTKHINEHRVTYQQIKDINTIPSITEKKHASMSFYWEQKCQPLTGVCFLSGWGYIEQEASFQF